jgi:hypothetical protein
VLTTALIWPPFTIVSIQSNCTSTSTHIREQFERALIARRTRQYHSDQLTALTSGCQSDHISMSENQPPRHKFVVGIHNPDVPNPWEYALQHGFDFSCSLISRTQLKNEISIYRPGSREFDETLLKNAVLRSSGSSRSGVRR